MRKIIIWQLCVAVMRSRTEPTPCMQAAFPERTLVVEWPLDSQEPLSVTLPAGQYELRIAGKSAGFKGTVSLILNGQVSAWDDALKEMQASVEQALTGGWEEIFRGSVDSLREAVEKEQKAA